MMIMGTATEVLQDSGQPRITARTRIWSRIDRRVMSDAAILPGVDAKALLFRNPRLTNVYVHQYYGMYDYANLGLK
jgi:peptide/nickel transport system substrate-binding protein